MADDPLDELYWVQPAKFTATRTRLAAAAKDRGDPDAAQRISGSRKPTTAAWVVNRLALSFAKTKQRLTELGERLRAAHAAMDGDRIRELSAEQRSLIDELARAAFDAAEVAARSAALRDDVTNTLHAAIADPAVAARLGRLAKAEQWSGFGDFGAAVAMPAGGEPKVERKQSASVRAALAAAEQKKADADAALRARAAELADARRRRDEAHKELDKAERALRTAEAAHTTAEQASRDATQLVKDARAQLE
jgi:hypothetical protein